MATADTVQTILTPEEVAQIKADEEAAIKAERESGFAKATQHEYQAALNGLKIKSLKGIHGMPYQFMDIADSRLDNDSSSFGRKYAERIVARMPLLLMTPGTPEFLTNYSESEKKGFMEYILNVAKSRSSESDLDQILKREGKYYTLKPDYPGYFAHVNPMARAASNFLGIGSTVVNGQELQNYNWEGNTATGIHADLNYKGASAFYIQSETQITDSFGNNTAESMLAGKANQLSDMGREINFILGGAGAKAGVAADKWTGSAELHNNLQNTQDALKNIMGGGDFIKSVVGGLQTVIAGGKLVFPEIWSDSHFSRSYDITIKLTTPDCDILSWYLNICIPIIHLIGFVSPKQAGPNGYISPFLVRAFYKGLFNCDMGIITNMSLNKGQEGGWTKEGLPTVVDITFTIKDLYSAMAITSNKDIKYGLMNNVTLLDYIANMCGVNINEPNIKRIINMYYTQNVRNKITDFVTLNVAGGLDQWYSNKVMKMYKRV